MGCGFRGGYFLWLIGRGMEMVVLMRDSMFVQVVILGGGRKGSEIAVTSTYVVIVF